MAVEIKCPIWVEEPAKLEAGTETGDAKVFSPRAGGSYRIEGLVRGAVSILPASAKALLTTWLIEQRRAGEASPLVTLDTLETVSGMRALKIAERKQRLFLLMNEARVAPGTEMSPIYRSDDPPYDWPALLAAWGECESSTELRALCDLLLEEQLVIGSGKRGHFKLTSKGFDYLDAVATSGANTLQVFVAMWFGSEMDEPWRLGFKPGIEDAGYKAFRIDSKEHNGKIDDEIVAEIKRSRFLVADFTCGGVFADGKFQAARAAGSTTKRASPTGSVWRSSSPAGPIG